MCDFNSRLLAAGKELGLQDARIEHGGSRGSAHRFRRHPHIVGSVEGRPFQFPLKSRPKDKCRGYFMSYLRALKRRITDLQGMHVPATVKAPSKCTTISRGGSL